MKKMQEWLLSANTKNDSKIVVMANASFPHNSIGTQCINNYLK